MLYRNFATEVEINAEYDPAMVSDRVKAIERFERMSATATKQMSNWYSCQFGHTEAEYVDVFPSGIANGAAHIFIHGGYWRALSTRQRVRVCGPSARAKGNLRCPDELRTLSRDTSL